MATRKICKKTLFLPPLYFAGALYIINSALGGLPAFHVVYRVIYVPLAFWAWTLAYAYFFRSLEGKAPNFSLGILLGLQVHLVLLLSKTLFSVVFRSAAIGDAYKIYIEAALYILIAASVFWSTRMMAEKKSFFLLPVLFAVSYPFYLSVAAKNVRTPATLIFIMLVSLLANVRKWKVPFLGSFLEKIKSVFASRRRLILAIFVLAFLFRLGFGVNVVQKTGDAFPTASDDGPTYDTHGYDIAHDILNLRSPEFTPTGWDAGYSLFLALVYRVCGRSFYAVILLQSILGACVPLLVYLLGEIIVGERAAAAAGIWSSMDQPLIMMSCVLGQEALYIPLLTAAILLITKYLMAAKDRVRTVYSILIGVLFGFANVVRCAILYFVPVISAYILLVRDKRPFLKKALNVFLILLFALIVISPLTYLNFLNSGKFYLLTGTKPLTQWEADAGTGYYFPSNKPLADMGVNPFTDIKGSLVSIAKDPLRFLAIEADILPRRIIAFFFCYNFGFFDPVYMVNAAKIPNPFASNLEFYASLLILAGFVLIVTKSACRRRAMPIFLLILYYVFMHVVMLRMGNIRYRSPIHPYLFIFGGAGLVYLIDLIKRGLKNRHEDTVCKP